MQNSSNTADFRGLLFSIFVLGLLVALFILPRQFPTNAVSNQTNKGLNQKTVSHEDGIENYDIRTDKSAFETTNGFRQSSGGDAVAIADVRENFVRGESSLRTRIPTLKVDYNDDIRIPEVIGPDVWRERAFLTGATSPAGTKHSDVLIDFLKQNNNLVGASVEQINALKVFADYTNPDGNLSFVELEQNINGIPVFRGGVKAGFTKNGEMIRVINNLAPGLNYDSLSTDFRNPADAVKSAAEYINWNLKGNDTVANSAASSDLKVVFGNGGDWDISAEKMYFPIEPGVARTAWRVLIWEPVNAYYVIVDAETGKMLWRKNISNDQTQSATFNVYANSNSLIDVADSPAPITPGPIDPSIGTQGVQTARSNRTLIGNEGVNSFNNLGWITDGTNGTDGFTDGNALQAGLDIDGSNGVDAPVNGTGRVFNFAYNPAPGMPAPPDDPTTVASRNGAVTQLFYINNRYHDIMYRFGFTEPARNFQNSNFGRGGAEADRVSAEAQDSSGTNNANFATPADGGRGRMQMYKFTQTPNRDGDLDGDVVIHEHTHGLSNRLIGNGSGLGNNRGGSMGEGWSDWYPMALEGEPTDPVNGIYSTGAYVTYQAFGLGTTNSYYGIRRFPYAVLAFTGGPNNRPHNPMTAANVNTGNCSNFMGAYAPGFASTSCNEVHNAGEVWAVMLWEVRGQFIARLGAAAGNSKAIQLVTDGMKLSPVSPNFETERNAIIAAAAAAPLTPDASADVLNVREGFRLRGMGFSATDNGTTVVQAFDTPNVRVADVGFSVSDSTGDNDGFPEPGENVLLTVPVVNPNTGAAITNVMVNVNGGTNVNYGTIADGQTVTMTIPFTIPSDAVCGSLFTVTINVTSSAGTQVPTTRQFRLGAPVGGAPVSFTNSTALTIPDSGASVPYGTTVTAAGLTGNKNIKLEITGLTHTFPGDLDYLLVGPGGQKFSLLSDSGSTGDVSNLTFTLSDQATAQPSTTQWVAGDFKPVNLGAGDTFPAPAPAAPYIEAPSAGAGSFNSVFGSTGSALNGVWTLYLVDDAGGDFGTQAGWKLTFEANDFACSISNTTVKSRADFDGDGKTDLSVFRPTEGNWYLQRSTAGFSVINWGTNGDKLVPGDYDGDNKTDTAVFRATDVAGAADFYVLRSNGFTFAGYSWGSTGDVPVVGDYDGDSKTDVAVFRPSTNTWFIINSGGAPANTITTFGQAGDVPVVGDFNGDGKGDLTVYRAGTWMSQLSGGGTQNTVLGAAGDIIVPADYNGDNKDDVAIFHPATGDWTYVPSGGGANVTLHFGLSGDVPVPGDYDGDGKDDQAVYRGGTWYVNRSTAGFFAAPFGLASDQPVPKAYVP